MGGASNKSPNVPGKPRMGFFGTHVSAGLLTTGVAAILWAENCHLFAFALIGLTHGLAVRSVWDCVYGMVLSGFMSLGFMALSMSGAELGYSLDPELLLPLLMAQAGASVPLRDTTAGLLCLVGNIVGILVILAVGLFFKVMFPPRLCVLELWEFLTILCAVPIAAVCTWWPADWALKTRDAMVCEESVNM